MSKPELISFMESKAKASGIASLDSDSKLEQMPTATDTGALPTTGGSMTGNINLLNNLGIYCNLSSGVLANLITRNNNDNIWIGTADEGLRETQGNIYLATNDTGNAYISRNGVSKRILDYGFVTESLWNGSWTTGTITVPNTANYTLFQIGMTNQGTTIPALKIGTLS